jgi:hypothetical protein
MTRWARGEAEVEQLLRRSELEAVTGVAADGAPLLTQARRTAATATGLVAADAYSAYVLAYDAARFACIALLAQQGLRATASGGHLGMYVPSRDRSEAKTERKRRFINSLIEACDSLPAGLASHLVIGGDYNVIARTHRPLHPGFLPFEFGLIENLQARGLADAFEAISPEVQAYSWIGRTGDGYRYDYLHVGPALYGLIGACDHLQETRRRKLSDHAAHTLSLRAAASRLITNDPATASANGTAALF